MDIKDKIRAIENFPTKGVTFRDITTLLNDAEGLKESVDKIQEILADLDFDIIVAPESRGFIFGMPIAYNLGKGFVPVRKSGKLPAETLSREYSLEYGKAKIEMHKDAIKKGQKVVIIDDLLATGGTAKAITEIINDAGGEVVNLSFLVELEGLGGREILKGFNVSTVIKY